MLIESTPLTIGPGDELLIGVPSIDQEHADLVVELDALANDPQAHPEGNAFSTTLGRLGAKIGEHFANEEKVLKSIGMADDEFSQHAVAHDEILEEYTQLNFDLMDGKVFERSAVLASIRGWIIDHIRSHDIKIRAYLPKT